MPLLCACARARLSRGHAVPLSSSSASSSSSSAGETRMNDFLRSMDGFASKRGIDFKAATKNWTDLCARLPARTHARTCTSVTHTAP